MAMYGGFNQIGRTGLMTFPGTINQAISALMPNKDVLDSGYLLNWLNCNVMSWRRLAASSRKDPNITRSDVAGFPVLLPPLPEQRKIAQILGTWDEAIATTEKLIAALERRKQGLMQRLLTGQVRFGEFVESEDYQETRYGFLPGDWRLAEIQSIGKVNKENADKDPNREWFYIDLSSVENGTIDFPLSRIRFEELPSRAQRVLHRGDVLMATVRPNLLGYGLCDFEPVDTLCSTGFALISPIDLDDASFIYYSLYGATVQGQIHGMVTGSSYPAINSTEVMQLRIFYPNSKVERMKIANTLQNVDGEMKALRRYKNRLELQKKGLMQRLLTGQVRVAG